MGGRGPAPVTSFAGITGLKTVLGATLGIVGFGEVGREVAPRPRLRDGG
jgi:phosphoglycerate dehydrogenase-like enzyme